MFDDLEIIKPQKFVYQKKKRKKMIYPTYDDSKGRGNPEIWRKAVEQIINRQSSNLLEILNLTAMPKTIGELKLAWKKVISENHPDHGGTTEKAQKINDAYSELKKQYNNASISVDTETTTASHEILIHPASATHIEYDNFDYLWLDKYYMNDEKYIAEKKLDGSRYLLYLEEKSRLLSRRISTVTKTYVDKTDNCPHLTTNIPEIFWGTILDGEVTHPHREKSDETTSIMGCDPATAVEKQKQIGWLKYTAYDILKYKGVDIRNQPLNIRKAYLKKFIAELNSLLPIIEHTSYPASQSKQLYENIISNDGEGIMLKDLLAPYGQGWYKVKKSITQDVFVIGYKKTKSFTVRFGMYNQNNEIIEMGSVPVPPRIMQEIENDKNAFLMRVMEIKAQEMTKYGSFRHPRFLHFRNDKDASQCIFKQ
jgi:ATP-dependent DNA ligase